MTSIERRIVTRVTRQESIRILWSPIVVHMPRGHLVIRTIVLPPERRGFIRRIPILLTHPLEESTYPDIVPIVSEGSVKIGASSVVIGNITAISAAIAGAVKGDIDVQGPVVLDSSAIVMGNIKSKSVQINNGAVIEGMCSQCYADVSPTSFFDDYKPEKKKVK